MSRLCRLKTKSHGDDGRWAYDEITRLRQQVATLTEQRDMAVEALQAFIDEHEECEDADGWMAFMCSPEAFHSADESLATIKGETE